MWAARWLTPITGSRRAQAIACPMLTPTSRQPIRPGPRVTATASICSQRVPAVSSARSMTGINVCRCARAAISGTTPPKGACNASCDRITLDSARGPLAMTAAAVSSQEVSIARTRRSERATAGAAVQPFDLERFHDLAEALLEARRLDRVRPHHDGVLVIVGVVPAATTDHLETELLIEPDGDVVGGSHLEREPARAELIGPLNQRRHQGMPVSFALLVRSDADGRDVRLVAHLPQPGIADDLLVPSQHQVIGRPVVVKLPVIGIARPRGGKDLTLNRLHLGDVLLAHGVAERSGLQLHHGAFLIRSSAAAG